MAHRHNALSLPTAPELPVHLVQTYLAEQNALAVQDSRGILSTLVAIPAATALARASKVRHSRTGTPSVQSGVREVEGSLSHLEAYRNWLSKYNLAEATCWPRRREMANRPD